MSHRLKLTLFALPFHVIGFAEGYLLREGPFTLLAKAWAVRGVVTKMTSAHRLPTKQPKDLSPAPLLILLLCHA